MSEQSCKSSKQWSLVTLTEQLLELIITFENCKLRARSLSSGKLLSLAIADWARFTIVDDLLLI